MILALNVTDILRSLFAYLCEGIYRVIAFAYNLFFEIASFKLLSSDGIKEIYQRVTFILAIVMLFYITLEFVKYVVQPDAMTDKEKGVQKVGFRMIGVVVLIAFVPMIFSLAYDLEHTIIANGTISKVILGKKLSDPLYAGRQFSAHVLDIFYNYEGDEATDCDDVKCDGIVKLNKATLINEGKLPYMTLGINGKDKTTEAIGGGKVRPYLIHFDGLFAVGVGIFLAYVLIIYCIDVAVRSIQLVYLQIIAPIPIIGFLVPKKDGIFGKWVKQCITTYLDIFIRVSLIYFILLICRTLLDNDVFENLSDVGGLVKIALIMGLLLFAQKAPKMLQELFPKMGAASGNFGLKAGERVAPMAARAIGGSFGLARGLVGGAIRRNRWRVARNKANGWATGFKRLTRAGREQNRAKREEMAKNRADAYAARIHQRDLDRQAKQKGNFDKTRAVWKQMIDNDSEVRRLKGAISEANSLGTPEGKALANKLGKQLNARYKELENSADYRRWEKARREMAGSQMAREMRQKNAEMHETNRQKADDAAAQVNAANASRNAALNRQNELMKRRDIASGNLQAAELELENAKKTGDATKISDAESKRTAALSEYEAADKEVRVAFAGGDIAVNDRNAAIKELNDAQNALEIAETSGNASAIAEAQERVKQAERKYYEANNRVNTINDEVTNEISDERGRSQLAYNQAVSDRDSANRELNAAQNALGIAEANGNQSDIDAAKERVRLAQEKYNQADAMVNKTNPSVIQNRDAAMRERDAAYQELEKAEESGDSVAISAANKKVTEAERKYNEVNRQFMGTNKEYAAADKKLAEALDNRNAISKEIEKSRTEQFKQNQDFFTHSAQEQYDERLQEARNNVERTYEQVIEDRNKSFKGLAGSVVSTAAGAVRTGWTGAKATKLSDIHKQVQQGVKNDIANVKAVQKYYDDGGTGFVDRTIQQVEKGIGMPTAYERTAMEIHSLDSKIKNYGAQAKLAKSYSSAADSTEDRFKNKAKDSKTIVDESVKIKTGLSGDAAYAVIRPGERLGDVVRRYKQDAVTAHAAQEAATKRRDDYRAQYDDVLSKDESIMTSEEKEIKARFDTYERLASEAKQKENDANYAAENVEKNAGRYDVVKVMEAFANSPNPADTKEELKKSFDGAGVENAWNLFERMKYIRQNPAMVAAMQKYLSHEHFEMFMSGKIKAADNVAAWDAFDTINNASKAVTNEYERLESSTSEEQRNVQTSNKTSADRAAQDYNGNNGGSGK